MPARLDFLLRSAARCLPLLLFSSVASAAVAEPSKTAAPDLSSEAVVIEQSELTIHFAQDGSSVRTWHMRERIQSEAGVRSAGIVSVPFAALTTTMHFDYVRVRKPSGEVIATATDEPQEVALPVTQQAPMYSDLRMMQLPVQSLGVGDVLEYQVTSKLSAADAPGALWFHGDFTRGVPAMSEVYEIAVPKKVAVSVQSKEGSPQVGEQGDERIYRWEHSNLADFPKKQEKDTTAAVALVQETYAPKVAISSFRTWAEVGAWYRGLMKERATPDAAIQAKADELTRGLTTDDAKVDALYRYVATQYRYISVSLGIGRLQPHTAAEVFRNKYGDCKDKHTLLQAMLAAEKIEAEPVLISDSYRVNEAIPMPSQFDHMITLVKLHDGAATRDVWLDATPEVAPPRMLLVNLRDKLALPIPPTGDAALVRTPAELPSPGFMHETITGKLDANGTLTAHFDATFSGDAEVIYRAAYHSISRAQWQELTQQISYNRSFAGDVSAVEASVPEKTGEPFHLSYDYTRKDFGDWPNRRITGLSPGFDSKLAEDATAPKRPIQLEPVADQVVNVAIELPPGYSAQPPADVHKNTAFATYTSTYSLTGHTLHMNRTLHYSARELPVSGFAAYRDFLKAVSDDAEQNIQLIGSEVKTAGASPGIHDSDDAATLIREADEHFEAHDLPGARALLDSARQKDEKQSGLWTEYARVDWYQKPKAIADYRKELEYHPENFRVYPALSSLLAASGDRAGMRETLESWRAADPADPRPYSMLGGYEMGEKHYKQAEDAFAEAVKRSSDTGDNQVQLARAELLAGEVDKGRASMQALIKRADLNDVVLNSAAFYLAEAGIDLPVAENASRMAIGIAEALSRDVSIDHANADSLARTRRLVADWDTLGWVLYKQQKLGEAEPYVKLSWLLSPDPLVGEHLATIEEARGELPDALTIWGQAVKLIGERSLSPAGDDLRAHAKDRIAALEAQGVKARPGPPTVEGGDPVTALRTYILPNPTDGRYASADFLLLFGEAGAEGARLIKGDKSLDKITPALLKTKYRVSLPQGSKGKVLSRGVLACTTGSSTCMLILLPAAEATLTDVVASAGQ